VAPLRRGGASHWGASPGEGQPLNLKQLRTDVPEALGAGRIGVVPAIARCGCRARRGRCSRSADEADRSASGNRATRTPPLIRGPQIGSAAGVHVVVRFTTLTFRFTTLVFWMATLVLRLATLVLLSAKFICLLATLLFLPAFALALLRSAPPCTCPPDCGPARLATRSTSVSPEGIAWRSAQRRRCKPCRAEWRQRQADQCSCQRVFHLGQFPHFLLKGSRWEIVA
jgi:hypothetical protein